MAQDDRNLRLARGGSQPGGTAYDRAVTSRDYSDIDPAIRARDEEDVAFERLYGPWEPATPAAARQLLAGFDAPWWVCGGYAVEAFTGVPRPHDDLDIGFFRRDLGKLRGALGDEYDLWSAGSGMLRPLNDRFPDLHEQSDQVWMRAHAWAPWRLDLLATADRDGRWVNKREPSFTADLADVTWVDADGIRYLAVDVVLAMKAKLKRPKDDRDLDVSLPLMGQDTRNRLRSYLERHHPGHDWLRRV